ncbi:MAG TPA: YdaS family helix-turn-helix protein [Zeimonas sp.]
MDKLRAYLNSLPVAEQIEFAIRCKTSIGYLRKALAVKANLGESLCIAIERESGGAVRCEDLRPDVDWAYLRGTAPVEKVA